MQLPNLWRAEGGQAAQTGPDPLTNPVKLPQTSTMLAVETRRGAIGAFDDCVNEQHSTRRPASSYGPEFCIWRGEESPFPAP